jgi:transposase
MVKKYSGMYLARIKRKYKDKTYISHLVRRSYRVGKKVKQQTLANVSHLPPDIIELIGAALKGTPFVPANEGFEIIRSKSCGHVTAVRGMLRKLGLHKILFHRPCRERDLVEAMVIARILDPQTKLATTRWWHTTTLPEELGLQDVTEDDLYRAMDWLNQRKPFIEKKLAARHLEEGGLVLYDVTSSYYEGSQCPLAAFGYNRDGKKGKKQVVYGLICDPEGRPVGVDVYPGNTSDPNTVEDQMVKLREDFGLRRVVLVGDRGTLTEARIEELKKVEGLDWISALRAPAIRKLVDEDLIQLSVFDTRGLAEITSSDYPGERLVACYNPLLARDRKRTRDELLCCTEELLDGLVRRVKAGRLKRKEKIGERLGRIIDRYKMAKHFEWEIDEGEFSYRRREQAIVQEEALDGIYVLRTRVPQEQMEAGDVVRGYKSLRHAERAFRTLKSVDLRVRPIHHRVPDRVKSHIFLCVLAYYVEWHLREAWRPMLFDDEHPGEHQDDSPVRPAVRSEGATQKAETQKRADGQRVHSFQTLLKEMATLTANEVRVPGMQRDSFTMLATPTPLQREALERIGVTLTPIGR